MRSVSAFTARAPSLRSRQRKNSPENRLAKTPSNKTMMTILNMATDDTFNKASADYAPGTLAPTTLSPAPTTGRRFRPRLWPTLATLLLVPLFIAAGQWQWNKAAAKAKLQIELEARGQEAALIIPSSRVDGEALRYRQVVARGYFEPQYQVLIDNRIYRGQAGYHVITPLHLAGSELRVLVNRGWVPAPADHRTLPPIATPSGPVEVLGTATVPATRFFTLGQDPAPAAWASVRQNLDLARYGQAVTFPLQPVVIQLDPGSTAGGFAREWPRPDDRRQTNLGYALQWWSFAATTVVLWLLLNFRKPT